MRLFLRDFRRALAQVTDPAFRGVLLKSLGWTVLLLGPFVVGFAAFIGMISGFLAWILPASVSLPWIGSFSTGAASLSGFGWTVLLFLSSVLMIPVAAAFVGFYQEDIAARVEARYYPSLPPAAPISFSDGLWDGARFLGFFAVVNIAALVVYLSSPLLAPYVFWLVNGLLLGRQFFELAAMRRIGRKPALKLLRRHYVQIWAAGVLLAIPMTIPVFNLVLPIIGVAVYTHMFHRVTSPEDG